MNRRPVPLSSMLHKGVAHGTPLVRPHSARRSPARACRTSARGSPAVEAGQATSEAARGAAGRRGEFTRNVRCPLEVPPLVLRRRRRLRRPGEVTLRRRRQNNRYLLILHGDPLAEPHDYADPKYVGCEARHCMTADDLRKIDDGRAAEWTAAQSSKFTAKVAPISATRPRPRPDLTLTLSLSPPTYAHHTFARTPRSIRPLHRPVAAPTFPINATGTNAIWKSARDATFRGGVSRARVARARGEAPSGPRWATPGLRLPTRS